MKSSLIGSTSNMSEAERAEFSQEIAIFVTTFASEVRELRQTVRSVANASNEKSSKDRSLLEDDSSSSTKEDIMHKNDIASYLLEVRHTHTHICPRHDGVSPHFPCAFKLDEVHFRHHVVKHVRTSYLPSSTGCSSSYVKKISNPTSTANDLWRSLSISRSDTRTRSTQTPPHTPQCNNRSRSRLNLFSI